MKPTRLILLLHAAALVLVLFTTQAWALPTADQLTGPVFVQPFAGLAVVAEDGGIGRTEPFFSDLPDGSFPNNQVVNLLGNMQAFDPLFNPVAVDIVGVEVTDGGLTFAPEFGPFDFAGNPSLTFADSVDFDVTTFSAGDPTFAFAFSSDAALDYSYVLLTTLPVGSFLVYDDVETSVIPEPGTFFLFGSGFVGLVALAAWRRRRSLPRP